MSPLTTYCPTCGNTLDPASGLDCPRCTTPSYPVMQQEGKVWGPGTGLLVWLSSVVLIIGFQIIAIILWLAIRMMQTGKMPQQFEIDWLLAVLSIASTFPAHLLTLFICWAVVSDRGQYPFWQTLGWSWHTQFKWVHAVALAFLMIGVGYLSEKYLPHKETDLDKLLKMGTAVRVLVATLAVLTAPLVEEVVYRGVLYSGLERAWGKTAGIALVTALFAGVHYFQYQQSYAVLTAIISLSLALTILRAATGKLLPCVATHMIFNGIQSVALLVTPAEISENRPAKAAVVIICQWFGLNY